MVSFFLCFHHVIMSNERIHQKETKKERNHEELLNFAIFIDFFLINSGKYFNYLSK